MKVLPRLKIACLVFLASLLVISPAFALTPAQLDIFAENDILFYDPEDSSLFGDCTGTSVSLSNDNSLEAFIWNYFAKAGITGVSDHAEVIAGILGNLSTETGGTFSPFAKNPYGYYGVFQSNDGDLVAKIEKEFGSDIWGINAAAELEKAKKALEIELDYLINPPYSWNHSRFTDYLDSLKAVTGEQGAAEYAELFMVTVERPIETESFPGQPLESSIVKATVPNIAERYQGAVSRRNNARNIFNKYTSNASSANRCFTSVAASEVTIFTDNLVSADDFTSFSDAHIYTGLTLYDGVISKINNLSPNDIREYVVLAFDLENTPNNEEKLGTILNNLSSKVVYVMIPNDSTNIPTTTLVKTQVGARSNVEPLTYSINDSPEQIANIISSEFEIEKIRGHTNINPTIYTQPYTGEDLPLCPAGTNTVTTTYGEQQAKLGVENAKGLWPKAYINGAETTIRLCSIPGTSGSFFGADRSYLGVYYSARRNGNVCIKEPGGTCNTNNPLLETVEVDLSAEGVTNPGTAVFSSKVAGSMNEFLNRLKDLLNISGTLTTNSSLRTHELQKILYAMNPWPSNWSWRNWSGAGAAGTSQHESGSALDLYYGPASDTNGLIYHYNKEVSDPNSKLSQYLKTIDVQYGTCPSASFAWSTRRSDKTNWDLAIITNFLCYILKEHGLYFTVNDENWHISPK